MVGGKRKKKEAIWLDTTKATDSSAPRPLFVADVEFRTSGHKLLATRVKKALLVLHGPELFVINSAALEAGEGSSAAASGTDIAVAVLKHINYAELLDISLADAATIQIRHSDSINKAKFTSTPALTPTASSTTDDDCSRTSYSSSNSSNSSASLPPIGTSSSMATSNNNTKTMAATSVKVTSEYFTLMFKEVSTAHQAAAAINFQRAQHSAMQQLLYQGIHAGFRCDLISCMAIPLSSTATNPCPNSSNMHFSQPSVPSSSGSAISTRSGGGGGLLRGCHNTAGCKTRQQGLRSSSLAPTAGHFPRPASTYAWGGVSTATTWDCSVPLPASWAKYLAHASTQSPVTAAEAVGAGMQTDEDITMDDLYCPADLLQGPKALKIFITTPFGVAVATVEPQHVRAALLSKQCRQVLAVPVQKDSTTQHLKHGSKHAAAGFRWTVSSNIPVGKDTESSSNGQATSAEATRAASAAASFNDSDMVTAEIVAPAKSVAGGTGKQGGSGSLAVSHTGEVYVAVTVAVAAVPRNSQPGSARGSAPARTGPGADEHHQAASQGFHDGTAFSQATYSTPGSALLIVKAAVCALLLTTAVVWFSNNPVAAALQQLLVAMLAVLVAYQAWDVGSWPRRSSTAAKYTWGSAGGGNESGTCCGWNLRLISGGLISSPSRYLQMQIAVATADKGLQQLRSRIASISSAGGAPAAVADALPVLVSSPEPAWLTPDIKQRYLNLNSSLHAAQDAARRAQKWRVHMGVDSMLRRPCPMFEQVRAAFPTYILLDENSDGHAVTLSRVGCVKDLCNLVFSPTPGTEAVTLDQVEHTLAVFNEYLVNVAVPKPLPAGCQVQIYDLNGFKLSHVAGDMITLFKMLARFEVYYPERLHVALVINAPGWFSYPFKLLSSFLAAHTNARIVVAGFPKQALASLAHHMGGVDNVPSAWGGNNTTPLEDYPANRRLTEFVRKLNLAGQTEQQVQKV